MGKFCLGNTFSLKIKCSLIILWSKITMRNRKGPSTTFRSEINSLASSGGRFSLVEIVRLRLERKFCRWRAKLKNYARVGRNFLVGLTLKTPALYSMLAILLRFKMFFVNISWPTKRAFYDILFQSLNDLPNCVASLKCYFPGIGISYLPCKNISSVPLMPLSHFGDSTANQFAVQS